jgi:hypothetical protein
MKHLKSNNMENFQSPLIDDWEERSLAERRSNKDKRIKDNPEYFKSGGKERRKLKERRNMEERRDGWMRVGQWHSESVFDE